MSYNFAEMVLLLRALCFDLYFPPPLDLSNSNVSVLRTTGFLRRVAEAVDAFHGRQMWPVQVAIAASVFLVRARKVPECQGTMLSCTKEAGDDPCPLAESCAKIFHTCPQRGTFRRCELTAAGTCAAGSTCYIECWGRRVPEVSSCVQVPIESCQDAYVVDEDGNGVLCMLKSNEECTERSKCFAPAEIAEQT
ncbi:unnamed protein product [Durusdinium trenchii]|uniref:Uncharacterized protein n=1 Tax=Durusdinium trenchii TaxID=1381693 RepID=A0ABP0RWE2_9DINO